MDLYKSEKMSPFSGCFSAILQLVIILSVFWLVSQPLTYMKKIDKEFHLNIYKPMHNVFTPQKVYEIMKECKW